MPNGNGTGSQGMGPMTGRGAGFCAGFNTPGFANPNGCGGRGMGRGRGQGRRGWRHRYNATGQPDWMPFDNTPQQQTAPTSEGPAMLPEALQQQMLALQGQLDVIRQQLADMSAAAPKEK